MMMRSAAMTAASVGRMRDTRRLFGARRRAARPRVAEVVQAIAESDT